MKKPIIAITIGKSHYQRLIREKQLQRFEAFSTVIHHEGDAPATKEDLISLLKNADACVTSWGVAEIDEDVVKSAPNLKAVVHLGGSVKRNVSDALFDAGIKVFATSPVLAESVAETTLGMMIMGQKRAGSFTRTIRKGGWRESSQWPARELRGKTVGIIGASQVGRHLIKLLKPFHTKVLVFDPYLDEKSAKDLGVEKCELLAMAKRCDILSLHAPANDKTKNMINKEVFSVMKDYALIVNSARGELIDEPAMIEELKKGRFYAYLDVTSPEPPDQDNLLRSLDNVDVIPHIAGFIEDCTDMTERAAEELERFFKGESPITEITRDQFDRIS